MSLVRVSGGNQLRLLPHRVLGPIPTSPSAPAYLGRPAQSRADCGAGPVGSCPQAGEAAVAPGAGRRGPGHSCGCSHPSQTMVPAHSPLQGTEA